MLRDVLENWISSLGERDFDYPFMNLIRGMGFFDIHFTHGPFEFGKDFIAKHATKDRVIQYAFQSKAGDMDGAAWTSTLGQLEELIGHWVVHPNYDESLDREYRLVITGHLKGKAAVSSKQYQSRLLNRGDGSFEVWDRQNLLDFLEGSDPRRPSKSASAGFKRLLAQVETGGISARQLEMALSDIALSENSIPTNIDTSLLETSLLVAYFLNNDRILDAVTCSAHAVRLAATLAYTKGGEEASTQESIGRALSSYFVTGARLVEDKALHAMEPLKLLQESGGAAALVTYPAVCMRIIEFLGLYALWNRDRGDVGRFREVAGLCRDFVVKHPGVNKPISDRYAVSLPPAIIALYHAGHHDAVQALLRFTTKWICDRYEDGEFGLASCYASPREEIQVLLGSALDFVDLKPNRESLVAVALADLAYYFCPELYPDIVNDIKAVRIAPSTVFPRDTAEALFFNEGGTSGLLNINYPDEVGESPLPHHSLQAQPRELEVAGGITLTLVVSTVLRDRLFSDCYARAKSNNVMGH